MKVFYVMVLVLVAGAVPSHGRTESEGIVFNKTQPHESMNNVTVSSSKLEAYDYLYLAMEWPRSFCNARPVNKPCQQQVPGRFTVHGLWPQKYPYDPFRPSRSINCTIFRQYRVFLRGQLNPSLVPGLNQYWLNLKGSENNNQRFWGTEYNKHGSCTFSNQNDFFYRTLKLVESLGDLALKLSLIRPGPRRPSIIPGGTYNASYIRDAVHQVTFKRPRLVCNTGRNRFQLSEIRFCAQYQNDIIQLTNCNLYSDCENQLVYFPPPLASRP